VFGIAPTYFNIRNIELAVGRGFSADESEQPAHVAIIGPTVSQNLFDSDTPPLDTYIKINGVNYLLIGGTKSKGGQGWMDSDDRVFVPYMAAMKHLFGQTSIRGQASLREIDIQGLASVDQAVVQEQVGSLLRKRHRTPDGATDDFFIVNMTEIRDSITKATDVFTLLLGGIAGISLVVGGIGIMNIMLVTVTERTREIGIRKAIGAKERTILYQFLVEAVIISGLGGLIGVGMGLATGNIIKMFTEFAPVFEAKSIVLSLCVSAGVGMLFGVYPAWRAARLDPVEALRYE
jgi:putative ABC transport system permease protein